MTISGHVHWEEGLFLQPHHLQQMQRQSFEQAATERRLMLPHAYGVIDGGVSRDELPNLMVRYDRLVAIMPSGLLVDVPGNADLPPLDITKAFKARSDALTVSIGVPLWYASRGNTVTGVAEDDWRIKRLFRVSEIERPDENTGENPQPVRLRRINARLLIEGEDQTDLEVLPLLRVRHGTGEEVGLPREDPAFVPPCLLLGGSPLLAKMARDLANAVDASRRELMSRLGKGGFSLEMMRGVQFEQVMRLQVLSRYAARLPALVETEGVTPFTMYLELRSLLAELAALYPDRDQFQIPEYDHDRPFVGFAELDRCIRPLLKGALPPSFIKVDFVKDGPLFAATLSDEHFTRTSTYYLAIKTGEDPIALARLVQDEDRFKLMPRSLAGRAIRGVKLVEERVSPLELPSEATLHYFRLVYDDNPRIWERIREEKSLTAQWPGAEVADYGLTLYMPVQDSGDAS